MGPESKTRSESEAVMEKKFQETAESSSSFDEDISGRESGNVSSDDEFVSDFQDYDLSSGFGEVFMTRKKPLTDHWMTYIQPLRWRCKWVELQMRQLDRLEHKYTRELAKYSQNELQNEEDVEPDLCSREVSFSGGHRRHKVFLRKRRKRIEDTEDIGTYMSKHILFSYYEKSKVLAKEPGNIEMNFDDVFGPNKEMLFLKTGVGDENLEQVLRNFATLMEHVSKLRIRLHKVMSNFSGKSSSGPKSMLAPCNALTSSARDPASPLNGREKMAIGSSHNASRTIFKRNKGDAHLPKSATMSLGEFQDDVLIYNDRILNGMNGFKDFNVQPAERSQRASKQCQGTTAPRVFEEPEMLTDEEPPPKKIRSIAQLTGSDIRKSQRRHKPRRSF